jgi:phosphoglycolate phosphatase
MIRTVLFDLDGTLLNTLEDLCDSVNAALKSFGFHERSKDEIEGFIGNGVNGCSNGRFRPNGRGR